MALPGYLEVSTANGSSSARQGASQVRWSGRRLSELPRRSLEATTTAVLADGHNHQSDCFGNEPAKQ